MKWFIASDLHGSALYTRQLMDAWEREKADRMLLLGDVLYHGPRNDLPDGYAPKEVIAMLNGIGDKVLSIRGNCEAEVDQAVLSFPALAEYVILCEGGLSIFATHGHRYNRTNPLPMAKGAILLCGHTHIPAWDRLEDFAYLNPGSVSIPKNGSWRGYMTLQGRTFRWKTLDGEVMHEETF